MPNRFFTLEMIFKRSQNWQGITFQTSAYISYSSEICVVIGLKSKLRDI